ncbi:MAG: histidine phosphatase family protein [Phycisphaerae bacterium]|nr:histidine phosphatase family protein [Phycisphaerae bacterium]
MSKLYLVQTGRTTWEDQNRVESSAGAPLTEQGADDISAAGRQLLAHNIDVIYASNGETERQTAGLLAKTLGLKVRTNKDLRELDYGLWQGLTLGEIKRRQPKVFRQWTDAPASVRPPDGETLQETQQRLRKATQNIIKRHKGGTVLVVLRPVALGVMRCLFENAAVETLWQHVDLAFKWACFEVNQGDL